MDVNELSSLLASPTTILACRGAATELPSDAVAPLTKAHGLNGWGVLEALLWNIILWGVFWLYVLCSSMPACVGPFVFSYAFWQDTPDISPSLSVGHHFLWASKNPLRGKFAHLLRLVLPDLANKITGCPVQLKFQISNRYFLA